MKNETIVRASFEWAALCPIGNEMEGVMEAENRDEVIANLYALEFYPTFIGQPDEVKKAKGGAA